MVAWASLNGWSRGSRGYCAIGGFSLYMWSSAFMRYLYEISVGVGLELPAVDYKQHI